MIWATYVLYEQVLGRIRCLAGAFKGNHNHHWCEARIPTLPTLFELYINEVADYIIHGDGQGINILSTSVQILFYDDNRLGLKISCRPIASQCPR